MNVTGGRTGAEKSGVLKKPKGAEEQRVRMYGKAQKAQKAQAHAWAQTEIDQIMAEPSPPPVPERDPEESLWDKDTDEDSDDESYYSTDEFDSDFEPLSGEEDDYDSYGFPLIEEDPPRPTAVRTIRQKIQDKDCEWHLILRIRGPEYPEKLEYLGFFYYHEDEVNTVALLRFYEQYMLCFPDEKPPPRSCRAFHRIFVPYRNASKWDWMYWDPVEAYTHTGENGVTLTVGWWAENVENRFRG